MIKKTWGLDEQMDAAIDGLFEEQEMTEHTPSYCDTAWRAELMGSEGWAVFAGPRMMANCLWEHQARFIVTACNCHADLLEALKRLRSAEKDCNALRNWDEGFEDWADVAELKEAQSMADEAIREARSR